MGRRKGEEKRDYKAAATCMHNKPTVFARDNKATDNAEGEAGFKAKIGELPLFYVTSPKLTRSRPVGRSRKIALSPLQQAKGKSSGHVSRREVSADVHLGEADAVSPLGGSHSQEIATWASSFRFDLDLQDAGRLQVMLERDARSFGRNFSDCRNWTETPRESFRFRNGAEEELSGNLQHGSYLKPPRQLEENCGSNRFPAMAAPANDNWSEKQGGCVDAAVQSRDFWDVVPFEARRNVAVDVPNSPERDEILRRLNELKAAHMSATPSLLRFGLDDVTSPSLLRFGSPNLDDVVTHHKEMAKVAARRGQRLKTDSCKSSSCTSPLTKSSSSTPKKKMVPRQSQEITTTLGELEIMSITGERGIQTSNSSPSRLRAGSPRRTAAQSAIQELYPVTPTTSRFKQSPRRSSNCSIQDQIVSIRKLQFPARAASNVSIPSPDQTPFLSARGRIPFKWEEEPGKPKTIADATNASQEETEVSNCMENSLQLDSSQKADENIVLESATVVEVNGNGGTSSARSSTDGTGVDNGDGGRIESHRYYGRAHLRGHSESSLGQSSRRYGTYERLEASIDLDASAAAKFLVELYDTPLSTPGRHGSSPMLAVPFKWEDAPGKAKVETPVGRPNMLQLPPRLAVPSCRSADSFSRELRASHPLAGFFAPCLTASSPGHQHQRNQSDQILVQYGSSKSLPPRAPSSPCPPERRKRHGLVGRCYSTPQEGCQIRVSKSTASSPVLQAVSRNLFNDETENSNFPGSWLQENINSSKANANSPSSPRSILCGPDEGSSSQTSASNVFSSGDLEDFTQQTNHSGQSASNSSNTSFESIEEDFAELPSPAKISNLHPLHSGEPQGPPKEISPPEGPPTAKKDSLKQSETENQKSQKQGQEHATHSPEPAALSPALANSFQSLEKSTSTSTSTSASAGASTANGEVNSFEGELPIAPKAAAPPTIKSMLEQPELNSRAQASPKRPTRLPYTMPSVADQLLASCDNSTRRQLIHDLSPRLLRQCSWRRLNCSSHGRNSNDTTPAPQAERYHADEVCPTSPVYTAALQPLSPPVKVVTQRHRKGLATAKPLAARPRRRARFMVSICRSLKRLVLGKQRRCKTVEKFEPKVMFDYAIAPTAFQFYQPN